MRVVHLACVAPPQTGGIGQVPFIEVVELKKRGVEAVLLAPDYIGSESVAGVRRIKSSWSMGNAASLDKVTLLPEVASADIVHLHYPFYGTAGLIAELRRQNKIRHLIITLHMDAQAPGIKGAAFNFHRNFFQSKILQSADVLIVSSLDYAKNSSFKTEIQKRDSQVVELPFGVDEMKFSPHVIHRERFGLPLNAKVLVFVGGMDKAHAFKGIQVLLKVIAELPDVYCILVGDGDLRGSYEKISYVLGLVSRVKFLGRVSSEDLPDVYRVADIFVLPSVSGAEAFGLVALEAGSCGIPVVASDLPGVRTVVENKVTGLLVKPGDQEALAGALKELLKDDGFRSLLGRQARERVLEKFTLKKHTDKLIAVYDKIISVS
ncbi:MAG: glycosyltransferase family 4 protein [Patescibacteria group bacterium]